jgi:hypothetical protein
MARVHRIPRTTFVTTRTPLLPSTGCAMNCTISDFRKQGYFYAEDWTDQISMESFRESVFRRTLFLPPGAPPWAQRRAIWTSVPIPA